MRISSSALVCDEKSCICEANRRFDMDDIRFADHIQQERERLHREREAISNQQQELENRLAALSREFDAIDAYEAAKTGKAVRSARQSGSRRTQTARRGSRREA